MSYTRHRDAAPCKKRRMVLKCLCSALPKAVILADSIAVLWQDIIGTGGIGLANASPPLAWLGIIAYSLQLYL